MKHVDKLLLAEALKIVWSKQRNRDLDPHPMFRLIHLFHSTLDLHEEILTEAVEGRTDPDLALKLARALTEAATKGMP